MQILEQIAMGWSTAPRGLRIGTAAALLVRMGIHHLLSCTEHTPDDQGVNPATLREHGVRFVSYVKGMRHIQRGRLGGEWK